tara:strand:+ start:665 stop:871 length:207 start_codon:yes stop_codon:yes gene_type:complete
MKKNVNGKDIEMTAEEISAFNQSQTDTQAYSQSLKDKDEDYANLKASAKAKLVAGEPLTEAEADTLVL